MFANLLVVSTSSRKEDHLLDYHAGPKVLDLRRPPPFREGRDLACHVAPCSKGAKVVHEAKGDGVRWVSHQFVPASVLGGGVQQKVCSHVSWSLTGNEPTACTFVLWWLKFGPTEGRRGGLEGGFSEGQWRRLWEGFEGAVREGWLGGVHVGQFGVGGGGGGTCPHG